MAEAGYKSLISYKLSVIAFHLGWEFVPFYYSKYEDARQRDQIKQALRSLKQNIVEGSSERSLSTKLKLYDVAKSSGMEALEDFEDILRFEKFLKWDKSDLRLQKMRNFFEVQDPNPSIPSHPSIPTLQKIKDAFGAADNKEVLDQIIKYIIDVLIRCGYLLDKQINAVEQRHEREGGYNENLLKRRLKFRNS